MATAQEARQQIKQARQEVQSRERQLETASAQVSSRQEQLSSQRVLRKIDRMGQLKRKASLSELEVTRTEIKGRQEALGKVSAQLTSQEQQIVEAERKQAAIQSAYKQLNESVNRSVRRNAGLLVASDRRRADEAFVAAGFPEGHGASLYTASIKGGETYQTIKALKTNPKSFAGSVILQYQRENQVSLSQASRDAIKRTITYDKGKFSFYLKDTPVEQPKRELADFGQISSKVPKKLSLPTQIVQSASTSIKEFGEAMVSRAATPFVGMTNPKVYGEKIGQFIKDPYGALSRRIKFTKSSVPDVVYDVGAGTVREPTRQDQAFKDFIPESKKVTRESLEFGGNLGKYAIPSMGVAFFAAETETELRDYNYNPIKFAKAEPLQAVLIGVPIIGVSAYKLRAAYKTAKYGRYLTPETQTTKVTRGTSRNIVKEELYAPKISAEWREGTSMLRGKPKLKKKGEQFTIEYYTKPTGDIKVVENIKFGKELKEFEGGGTLTAKGVEKTKIDYGRYYKTTEVGKTGEGTVRLFKKRINLGKFRKDKLVAKGKTSSSFGVKEPKVKVQKTKIDEATKGGVTLTTIKQGGKPAEKVAYLREGDQSYKIIDNLGKTPEVDLGAVKIAAETKTTTSTVDDLARGYYSEGKQIYFKSDIITSTERKALLRGRTGKGKGEIGKRKSQEIVYGQPKEAEGIMKDFIGKASVEQKKISPTIQRLQKEGTQESVVRIVVNPKSKLLDPVKEVERLKGLRQKEIVKQFNILAGAERKAGREIRRAKKLEALKVKLKGAKEKARELVTFTKEEKVVEGVGAGGQTLSLAESSQGILGKVKKFQQQELEGIVYVAPPAVAKGAPSPLSLPKYGLNKVGGRTRLTPVTTTKPQDQQLTPVLETQQIQLLETEQILSPQVKTMQLPRLSEKVVTEQVQVQQPVLELAQVQLQQQVQLQIQQPQQLSLRSSLTQKQIPRQPTETVTTTPPPPPPIFGGGLAKRIAKKLEEEPELFEVFVTKAGKDVKIGKRRTQREAERLLKKELKGTLRAGGYLTRGGKALQASNLKTFGTLEFRPSKISSTKIIQKKGKRLGASREVAEIQLFKKKTKSKRKKRNGIW